MNGSHQLLLETDHHLLMNSLLSVTNNTAVLFGGDTTNGDSDNIYIINFTKTSVVSVLISII